MPPCRWKRQTHNTTSGIEFSLAIACDKRQVFGLYFLVTKGRNGVTPRMHPNLNEALLTALLDLPLSWLHMTVYGGELYPQLGALPLQFLLANHYCMTGTLPPNLLYGWPSLGLLRLTRQGDAIDFNDPDNPTRVCGIRYDVADAAVRARHVEILM
jgi:hypothetical protein